MKVLVSAALVAALVVAADLAPASKQSDPAVEGSFVVAQRFCPNRRC